MVKLSKATRRFSPITAALLRGPSVKASVSERVSVPIAKLKAIFFVRDFKGSAAHKDRKTFSKAKSGRRIEVTFLDNEVLVGTTLNYRADAQGFFSTVGPGHQQYAGLCRDERRPARSVPLSRARSTGQKSFKPR
jgi:hypothetical protein